MKKQKVLLCAICLLALAGVAEGLGSLTKVGSVWKKTVYECVIRSLAEDNQGRLWAGTFGAGLLVIEDGKWRQIATEPNGLPDMRISKIIIKDGFLYVATVGGGAVKMDISSQKWLPLLPQTNPSSKYFHAFSILRNGSFVLGAVGEGVFISKNGEWLNITENDGLANNWVNDSVETPDGIWLATFQGLALLKDGKINSIELPTGSWNDGNINVIAVFRDHLFLGTGSDGLIERVASLDSTTASAPEKATRKKIEYKRFRGIPKQIHALLPFQNLLWIAGEEGLFTMDANEDIKQVEGPWGKDTAFKSLGIFKNAIVSGTDKGIIYYLHDGKNWSKILDYQEKPNSGGHAK